MFWTVLGVEPPVLCSSRNAVARPCPLLWLRALGVPWLDFGGSLIFPLFLSVLEAVSGALGRGVVPPLRAAWGRCDSGSKSQW